MPTTRVAIGSVVDRYKGPRSTISADEHVEPTVGAHRGVERPEPVSERCGLVGEQPRSGSSSVPLRSRSKHVPVWMQRGVVDSRVAGRRVAGGVRCQRVDRRWRRRRRRQLIDASWNSQSVRPSGSGIGPLVVGSDEAAGHLIEQVRQTGGVGRAGARRAGDLVGRFERVRTPREGARPPPRPPRHDSPAMLPQHEPTSVEQHERCVPADFRDQACGRDRSVGWSAVPESLRVGVAGSVGHWCFG